MTDTDNVVSLNTTTDGGVKQQRYRRKQGKQRKPRVERSPSDPPKMADNAENNAAPPVTMRSENQSPANDMVTFSERLPDYASHRAMREASHAEFAPERGGDLAAPTTVIDTAAYAIAVALAGSAAYFSISGMVVLFPGAGFAIVAMGCVMESAKLIVTGWLASRWRETLWLWRMLLIMFTLGLMSINAVGLYSQLVAAHVGHHGEIVAAAESSDAAAAARIEVAESRVADIDRRLSQIDGAVEGAAKRGKARTAEAVMRDQRKARAELAAEREAAVKEMADLEAARAAGAARGRAAETEAAPVQYVAQLFGIRAGGEEVIRWLIAAMVACCDPLAVVLAAAIAGRRRRRGRA